jgi:hypothetical protein
MPHYCRICGRGRAHEKFTGRGHRDHICKDCQRLPRDQLDRIDRLDELYGFLEQSNISAKNIARLVILAQHANSEVRDLALLILDVARVKPHKRRRWKFLAQKHPELFLRLKSVCGDDVPETDLYDIDSDNPPLSDLEFGDPGLPHSGPDQISPWEDYLNWLVDSED